MTKRFFFSLLLLSAFLAASDIPLFSGGGSAWRIQISPGSTEIVKFAAVQLQQDLEKLSGCRLPLVCKDGEPERQTILIGSPSGNSAVARLARRLNLHEGSEQKLAVHTMNGCLILAGRTDRGALHAVNEFSYRHLGIRCFWPENEPGGMFLPSRHELFLPELHFNYDPPIQYRGYHFLQGTNIHLERFLARNQGNIIRHGTAGGTAGIRRRHEMGFYCYDTGHNIDPLHPVMKGHSPASQSFPKNWLAERNGKASTSHFCWSNPEVIAYVGERLQEYIRNFPDIDILGFYPTDNRYYCQCERCRKTGLSNAWFNLVSTVSKQLKRQNPSLRTATIAYEGYQELPDRLSPDCEFIEYALYKRCFSHPLSGKCSCNRAELRGTWGRWLSSGIPTGIYGYEFDIVRRNDILLPIWKIIEDEMRFFAARKVIAVLPEITGTGTPSAPNLRIANYLTVYLCTRLMWNPQEDADSLIRDFCSHVYPEARKEMHAYYRFLSKCWCRNPRHLPFYLHEPESIAFSFLDDQAIRQGRSLLNSALAKVRSGREKDAVEKESRAFSRWVEYSWQGRPQVLFFPPNTRIQLSPDLSALHNGEKIIIRQLSKGILKGSIQTPEGRRLSFQGHSKVEISCSDLSEGTHFLQLDSSRPPLEIPLSFTRNAGGEKSLLFLHPGNSTCAYGLPKIRRQFFAKGWQVRLEDLRFPLPDLPLSDYSVIMAVLTPEIQPGPKAISQLKEYMNRGGVLLLSLQGNMNPARLLNDPTLSAQWSDDGLIPRIIKSRRYPWMNNPDPFERELRTFSPPPAGFDVPSDSRWKRAADMKNKKGVRLSPLLMTDYGKGALVLTTGTLGVDENAYADRIALSSSRGVTITALAGNLHHYYSRKQKDNRK